MREPTAAPPIVLMTPCKEAALPAIDPIGSIAMAPKFDAARGKHASVIDCKMAKVSKDSVPDHAIAACTDVTRINATSAECEIRCIPTRSTRRAFTNVATPIAPAHAAKVGPSSWGAKDACKNLGDGAHVREQRTEHQAQTHRVENGSGLGKDKACCLE